MVLSGKLGAFEGFKAGFVEKAENSRIDRTLWYWVPVLIQGKIWTRSIEALGTEKTHHPV